MLSKNTDDITFYSNMPMIEASKDLKFTKKFMIGIAFLLKKNQRLNIIHNLDRPFNELLLGLEGWIPLYMTGLINPYYIKKNQNELYSYINLISKTAILDGKCVNNNIDTSMIYVSSKKEDITKQMKDDAEKRLKYRYLLKEIIIDLAFGEKEKKKNGLKMKMNLLII